MPTYEYKCNNCNITYSETRRITEAQILTECPTCDTKLLQRFSAPAVSFNGKGFYSTDKKEK